MERSPHSPNMRLEARSHPGSLPEALEKLDLSDSFKRKNLVDIRQTASGWLAVVAVGQESDPTEEVREILARDSEPTLAAHPTVSDVDDAELEGTSTTIRPPPSPVRPPPSPSVQARSFAKNKTVHDLGQEVFEDLMKQTSPYTRRIIGDKKFTMKPATIRAIFTKGEEPSGLSRPQPRV